MKTIKPKTSIKLGKEFEDRCDKAFQTVGAIVCTPRKTAQIVRKGPGVCFPVPKDFFGIFDGMAQLRDSVEPTDIFLDSPQFVIGEPMLYFYQCKRDWLMMGPKEKNELTKTIGEFTLPVGCRKLILYLKENNLIGFIEVD